ncbi:MAG: thioredoxin family protein, partial [Methylococcales bacterium]
SPFAFYNCVISLLIFTASKYMKIRSLQILLFLVFVCAFMPACVANDASNVGYISNANPDVDLENAKSLAAAGNKKILVVAGGDWCRWCHVLNKFLVDNEDVKTELDDVFVVVKVYIGEDNGNEPFFSKFPAAVGYPHFWVLSSEGNVLKSVSTAGLEKGDDDYDKEKFLSFIKNNNVR